jgi:unconventional prefoldin RPB5 interactor 1
MMSRLDELEKEELGNGRNEVNAKVAVDDEEYARMMSRLDELEKEELEAEFGNGRDEDNAKVAVKDEEYASIMSRLDELEKEEAEAEQDNETDEDEKMRADFDQLLNQRSLDKNIRYSEVMCWIKL